jgi:hypothetical protein
MSLNPIQLGAQVVDQFGRYLMTTFPIADEKMSEQVKKYLRHGVGGERYLVKGPYVYLNQPFEQGPPFEELLNDPDLGLHPAVKKVFPYEYLHKHQELAVRSICSGKHTIMATGTGSGKTEAFLLPIVDHCLKLRDEAKTEEDHQGIVAVLVYPMNALVNDQLKRLRPLLAGTKITFGRYTGETPQTTSETNRLETPRSYTKEELEKLEKDPEEVPIPWEECASRSEILSRKPRILLTNYKQIEYMLLRDKDLELFKGAQIKFLVFDEVHTYTGVLGSEVACLIRRLKSVTGSKKDEITCIGTSATVTPEGRGRLKPEDVTKPFGSRLFGVPEDQIEIVTEIIKKPGAPPSDMYTPNPPQEPLKLMKQVLEEARDLHLQDEVSEVPDSLLSIAEDLCGQKAQENGSNSERLFQLLNRNRLVFSMGQIFTRPILFNKALPRIKTMAGRSKVSDKELSAEIISYLTLGAIAQEDGEPLLRPKVHYFVQGLHGLWASPEVEGWKVHFDLEKGQNETNFVLLPLRLCRGCGQHYFRVVVPEDENEVDLEGQSVGYRPIKLIDDHDSPGAGEIELYITDRLTSEEEGDITKGTVYYLCRYCGALHSSRLDTCQNEGCRRKTDMLKVFAWAGELTQCRACTAVKRGDFPVIRPFQSADVSDITILGQSMLSAMNEKALQKLLIFADNRQDAAYQAGWMEERSKRFRLRHLLYRILERNEEGILGFDKLVERLLEEAQDEGILPRKAYGSEDEEIRVRWFLLEEFATTQQRRST